MRSREDYARYPSKVNAEETSDFPCTSKKNLATSADESDSIRFRQLQVTLCGNTNQTQSHQSSEKFEPLS